MINKRRSSYGMRDCKRDDFDDSGYDNDDYGAPVYPKKRRTATICTVSGSGFGFSDNDTPMSSSFNESSSYGEEIESDSKNYSLTTRKSSRGRVSGWSKSKLADIESGVHEIYLKRRDAVDNCDFSSSERAYEVNNEYDDVKLSLPSYKYHPYCQDSEDSALSSVGLSNTIDKWNTSVHFGNNGHIRLGMPLLSEKGVGRLPRVIPKQKKTVYGPEDFALGDIVWAKSGKRFPAWPAIVIDPMLEVPEAVLSSCIPGALCVM